MVTTDLWISRTCEQEHQSKQSTSALVSPSVSIIHRYPWQDRLQLSWQQRGWNTRRHREDDPSFQSVSMIRFESSRSSAKDLQIQPSETTMPPIVTLSLRLLPMLSGQYTRRSKIELQSRSSRTIVKRRCQHVRALMKFAGGHVGAFPFAFRSKFGIMCPRTNEDPRIARQAEGVDCTDICVHLCGHLGA